MIVPLLVLWFGYGEHEATGTSLAAIIVIAAFGVAFHGAYGNVDVGKGLLVGVPAVAGVVIGTGLQQRLSGRTLLADVRRAARGGGDRPAGRMDELAAILIGLLGGAVGRPDGRRRGNPVRARRS